MKSFWLLTIGVFLALLLPVLVQEGMFSDGVIYAAISNNLAQGLGSLWEPIYANPNTPFYDHPPLVMGIESVFFRLFGDSFFTERLYSFCTALLTAFGIALIWREFKAITTSWLAILLWILVPVSFWSYSNNMLENTLSIFTLFATFFIIKSFKKHFFLNLILAALCLIAAFLSKGVVGLFPLVIPFLYGLIIEKSFLKKSIISSLLLFFFTGASLTLLFYFLPEAKENITRYFDQQLLAALENKREITTNNRLFILWMLFTNLLPIIGIALIVQWRFAKSKFKINKTSIFFFLIGISASLPIIISLKQREFYLVPSIPYFALAFAFFIYPLISDKLNQSKKVKTWLSISGVILISGTFFSSIILWGNFSRDEKLLKDIYIISENIPKGTSFKTHPKNHRAFDLIAYLNRVNQYYFNKDKNSIYYLFQDKDEIDTYVYENYTEVEMNLNQLKVFKRNL